MIALLLLTFLQHAPCLNNGLALTPPMGWCSWERFECITDCAAHPDDCISEDLIVAQAEKLLTGGYLDAGYVYLLIDDCWQSKSRDASGRLQADAQRFPHGMKWLAEYLHERGLKLGIYTNYGSSTCAGNPSTDWDHQELDAQTFADWGVDMVKVDGCHANVSTMNDAYPRFGRFLNSTGRHIVYSCSWVDYLKGHVNHSYVAETCNMWRFQRDMVDQFWALSWIMKHMGEGQHILQPVAGPGAWNDPDQLVIGDHRPEQEYGLTEAEERTMMAMWAIWASPLLMSNDLRSISQSSRAILLNRDVIAVNQDRLGIQGTKVLDIERRGATRCVTVDECTNWTWNSTIPPPDEFEIWARPLDGGDVAVVVYNPGWGSLNVTVDFGDISSFNGSQLFTRSGFHVHDLFSGFKTIADQNITLEGIPPHGCRMFRLSATVHRDATTQTSTTIAKVTHESEVATTSLSTSVPKSDSGLQVATTSPHVISPQAASGLQAGNRQDELQQHAANQSSTPTAKRKHEQKVGLQTDELASKASSLFFVAMWVLGFLVLICLAVGGALRTQSGNRVAIARCEEPDDGFQEMSLETSGPAESRSGIE